MEKPVGVGFVPYDLETKSILLHRRDTTHNNTWDCFGGGLEPNETIEKALAREICEELGCDIDAKMATNFLDINGKKIFLIPFSKSKTSTIRLCEGAGFAWFSFRDAYAQQRLDDEAYVILRALEGLMRGEN